MAGVHGASRGAGGAVPGPQDQVGPAQEGGSGPEGAQAAGTSGSPSAQEAPPRQAAPSSPAAAAAAAGATGRRPDVGAILLDKSIGDRIADGIGTPRVSKGEARRLGERSQQDLARLVDNARAAGYPLEFKDAAERQKFGVAVLSLKSGTASKDVVNLVAGVVDRSDIAESLATKRGGVVLAKSQDDRLEDKRASVTESRGEALRLGRTSQEALATLVRNIGVETVRSLAVPGKLGRKAGTAPADKPPEDLRRFDAAWSRLQAGRATEEDLLLVAEGVRFSSELSAGVLDQRKAPG